MPRGEAWAQATRRPSPAGEHWMLPSNERNGFAIVAGPMRGTVEMGPAFERGQVFVAPTKI